MNNEIYTPQEKALVEGAKSLTRHEFAQVLLTLIDMEMTMLMQDMEGATDAY